MSIEIHCQSCQKRYRVKAELAGKKVRCANCGNAVTVPGNAGPNGDAPLDDQFMSEIPQAPVPRKPTPPKAPPPPVPRQVVRFDPRFDPQASDIPAPPPPVAPKAKPAPQRATPQPAARKDGEGRELRFADDDPLFMTKPKPRGDDNLADTAAAAPALSGDEEPRIDEEPLIPRGKRGSGKIGSGKHGSGKLADTDAVAPSDEPNFDLDPSDRPVFAMPKETEAMKKLRLEQAAGKERRCTGCGAVMKVGAIICLNCGFNSATGERGGGPPADWEGGDQPAPSAFSKYFGRREWRPEDRALRKLTIFGFIVCLIPLLGLKVPYLVKPGAYIGFAGLAFGWIAAGLFAKRMQFTRAIAAAIAVVIAFAVSSTFRPVESDPLFTRDDAPKNDQPRVVKPTNPSHSTPVPTVANASEVMLILKGPGEGIDPVNWYLSYLPYPDTRVRFKSAQYLIDNTPPGRKEEVSKAFEGRLTDEHPQMRRLAVKGVALYIDDHTTSVLTPLLKDEEEDVRADVYHLFARLKDTKALPAIVSRMSEDGPLAREALAAFDASQKSSIPRAFELSLRSDNPRQRELAARELATWGGPNTSGLLLGLLEDGDVGVRCAAVITLGKLKDPQALDAILGRLMYDRAAATQALAAFGSGAEKPVLSLLKTGATDVRMAAAEVLGSIGTRESIPALHDAASENDLRLAAIAKEAWRKIDPDNFTPSMESVIDMESEMTSRQREGLQRLAELKPDKNQDRVAKMLVKMAMSLDVNVREEANNVLATWGTKDTAPQFIDLLTEKQNPTRRQMAETALGALRDPRGAPAIARFLLVDYPVSMQALTDMGPAAEDVMIQLLMHERLDIRRDAVHALKIWGSMQRAHPALLALLQKDRANLGNEILDAMATIHDRPIQPRRPMSRPVTQPAK